MSSFSSATTLMRPSPSCEAIAGAAALRSAAVVHTRALALLLRVLAAHWTFEKGPRRSLTTSFALALVVVVVAAVVTVRQVAARPAIRVVSLVTSSRYSQSQRSMSVHFGATR